VLVAGTTSSTDLPCVTAGGGCGNGALTTLTAGSGSFVTRLNAALTGFLQSTFVAGNNGAVLRSVQVHPASGEVFVAGHSSSTSLPCMVAGGGCANGAQSVNGGNQDVFVYRLNAALSAFLQGSFFGGSANETLAGMALHPTTGEFYLAGSTASPILPCATAGGACGTGGQSTFGGVLDGFVVRVSSDLTANDNTPDPIVFTAKGNVPPGSLQASNPAHVTGIAGAAAIYVDGQPGSAYCVSSTSSCATCDVSAGWVTSPGTITTNTFACVRHVASTVVNDVSRTRLHIGGSASPFFVTTGNLIGGGCGLDVDGNGAIDALTDGLIVLRAMFGLTGTAVTNGAIGGGAARSTWAQIQPFLNGSCGTNFAP
jgi:hypothetical protein